MTKHSLIFITIALIFNACALEPSCGINETRCTVDKAGQANYQFCTDGYWSDPEPCSSNACDADQKACADPEVTMKCENDASTQIGLLKVFQNDVMTNSSLCSSGFSCKDESSCGECANDAQKCEDGRIYRCKAGQWDAGQTCENDTSCKDRTLCGDCANGDQKCENGKTSTCIQGVWANEIDCPNATACKSATECADCDGEISQCLDGKRYKTCSEGIWKEQPACSTEYACVDGQCASCIDGTIMCAEGVIYHCQNGIWDDGEACPNDASCEDTKHCGGCLDGDKVCINDANGQGKIQICSSGKWLEVLDCANAVSCAQNVCGECTNGEDKCGDFLDTPKTIKTITQCDNGRTNLQYCSYGNTCDNCTFYTPHDRIVTAYWLNVRSTSNFSTENKSNVIGALQKDEIITVYAESNTGYLLVYKGSIGWISKGNDFSKPVDDAH